MVRRHISNETKELALSMSLQGISDLQISEFAGISERSVKRWRSSYRNSGVSRKPVAPGRPSTLTSMEVKYLCDCVKRQPDMALAELQAELRGSCNVEVSLQTILRTLQLEGYTMKTITRPIMARSEQDREEFKNLISTDFRPEQLVFVDESHFNRLTLRRPYAWTIRGERTCRFEFSLRGTKYSLLPAISLDGIEHFEVFEKAITGEDFRQFVQGLLPRMNKWPLPKSVLVIDNASIHKVAGIREMVEERGVRLLFLPAYSPDFNPVELAFSSIKAWLHRNRESVEEPESEATFYNVFGDAVRSVTPEMAMGFYKDCGYNIE